MQNPKQKTQELAILVVQAAKRTAACGADHSNGRTGATQAAVMRATPDVIGL